MLGLYGRVGPTPDVGYT